MVSIGAPKLIMWEANLSEADLGSAMPTSGGLYWWTHFFASPATRNPLSFLVGYSNTLGLVGGLCSIDCESPIKNALAQDSEALQMASP